MDIDSLALFVRAARLRNIRAAGRELGVSPATASARIAKLEQELGVRLLQRTTRSVSLTEDGEALLPHADQVLDSVSAAHAAVGSEVASPSGRLRVTAPASFGRMHMVPALPDFFERYPDLTLDLHLSDQIEDLVEGGFDVAIRDMRLPSSTLVSRKLAPDQRIICASPDYIERHGAPESLDELVSHRCVIFRGIEKWDFIDGDKLRSIRVSGQLIVDNGEAMRDATLAGLGPSINATWSVSEHLRSGALVPVLSGFKLAEATISAVYPLGRLVTPKVRVFIDFFVDRFGSPPYWDRRSAPNRTHISLSGE
ncbi:MAG: LysR family transcriptional regulator [Gammaproteobacteria bacterium]|nr:LysR family transcriptional regulator [Gammaproteobacteria bacterium]